jgi:hypothetical protein
MAEMTKVGSTSTRDRKERLERIMHEASQLVYETIAPNPDVVIVDFVIRSKKGRYSADVNVRINFE